MDSPNQAASNSRREFLRDALRYSVLAGMGAIVASAVARRAPWAGAVCPGSGECSGCSLAAGCTLPRENPDDPHCDGTVTKDGGPSSCEAVPTHAASRELGPPMKTSRRATM